ncbi:MAG: ComEC/Rec2 family competence protein [Candidatus Yanofskybacteria bacterium]|nr:ComEC/Rec2 family competence protein [Candidatus Yanofskybacteria bacterium]
MHKSQLFFILLCCFVAGVAIGSFLAFSQTILYLFFIPPLTLVGIFWRRNWKIVFVAFSAAIFLFGILRTFDARVSTTFVKKFAETNFTSTLSGYVASEFQNKGDYGQFVFRVKELKVPDFTIPEELNENILVIIDSFPRYRYGDNLSLDGKISLPKNYNDFDYISYLAKDQVYTISYRPKIEKANLSLGLFEKIRTGFFSRIFSFKNKFENAVGMSVREPHASFLNGILLGSKQSIPQDLKDDFNIAGISHITAISGYNITIVALLVSWFLLFFFRRDVAFWFSVAAIFVFTILTGASASVVRSALMGGLVLMANNSGRLYDSKNSLALVAFLMVLANPMILRYDIGFQLSFMATVGILYLAPLLKNYFKRLPSVLNFGETFLMTVSAQIMVLPLILYYFHKLSIVALPANLLILPLVPLGMLAGFVTGITGMILPVLGLVVGSVAWLVSSLIIFLARFFSNLPFAALNIFISWYAVVLIYIFIFWFLYYLFRKQKIRQKADSE